MSHAPNMAMRASNINEKVQPTNRSQQPNKPQAVSLSGNSSHISTMANVATPTLSQSGSSRSSSRRTSSVLAREPLPTPPPDPRANSTDNIFKFPPTKQDYPPSFHGLLDFHERQTDFYKTLNRTITEDCQKIHGIGEDDHQKQRDDKTENIEEIHRCECCARMREECANFLDPFQQRTSASISATLAAYGAIEQLQRMYSIWDQYLDVESRLRKRKECLKYLNLLEKKANEEVQAMKKRNNTNSKQCLSETEAELEQSISLLDSILTNDRTFSLKPPETKLQRERSKSVMVDDMSCSYQHKEPRDSKELSGRPLLLRRQSTYSDGKAGKVSKWTKVKAAFKWERANVPALTDCSKDSLNNLIPVNHEVARYLRVPSAPCGAGSSADSILSSSSGHLLSEMGGTPGTISSASSVDDLESQRAFVNARRRDSAKSDTAIELGSNRINTDQQHKSLGVMPAKSPSNRSFRKSKIISDFEVLPEDVIADIKSTLSRRTKPPPSPLDLNLKQDLNDLENFYSPTLLKSPKDVVLTNQRSKKMNSPGNSSVPSSPSRHSDFFAEFESEDLSSGEFSEPNTPTRKSFQQKQHEINKGYQMLRAKLDMEFQAKSRQWEKMKRNPNTCRTLSLITSPSVEEPSSKPPIIQNLCAKQLEENLTPEFKKKLRKWRVKKQVPVGTSQSHHQMPMSPTTESKAKIDWHLWKTGQLKLEGQGLCALPDQKNLPEDFQKKLEQWDKIKRSSSTVTSGQDTVKRSATKADCAKKSSDDDKILEKRTEKTKPTEKEKTEKLAKLKAIGKLTDHPVKKIEVQTSEGVLKFEGISRKFTRKLYEWEKARGIGPESSTFALLHPGYCPIDVGKISKENHKNDNSPTLSRSISLDSISIAAQLPVISHQASSLSLNDVNELKEMGLQSSTDLIDGDATYKKYEEPEAVMVEVEDDIVETASPLVTVQSKHEHQTPVYKYEETTCNVYCNLKRVISYESNANIAPLLSTLSRTDKLLAQLNKLPLELVPQLELKRCVTELSFIRQIYPSYSENLGKSNSLNAISDIQNELSRLNDLIEKSPLDEACCQETINECKEQYTENLAGLYEALEFFRQNLHEGSRYPKDAVPDINITSEDGLESSMYTACQTSSKDRLSTTLEATDEVSCASVVENSQKPSISVHRTFSTNSAVSGNKKKLRLRRVGSRQNSKTETESSDDGTSNTAETPRRIKRKNFRLKQRSFDDDFRRFENNMSAYNLDENDQLKRKEKHSAANYNMGSYNKEKNTSKSLVTLNETSALFPIPEPIIDATDINMNSHVFVKTKCKIFTTVEAPTTTDGIAVIEHDLEVNTKNEESQEERNTQNAQKDKNDQIEDLKDKNVEEYEKNDNQKLEADDLKIQVKRKSLTTQKSQSMEDLTALQNNENKMRSSDSLHSLNKGTSLSATVRIPLASDSFRAKSCMALKKDSTGNLRNSWFEPKREHIFKKNPIVLSKSNGVTVKKIETKIAKNNSGSCLEQAPINLAHNKSDNTIPRIYRRTTRHSLTPTTLTSQQLNFDYPEPTGSEPTSPFIDNDDNKPTTPLSERAQKLRKAKQEFLKSALPKINYSINNENIIRKQSLDHSRQSLSSTAGTEGTSNLSKSVSVDTFTATTPIQSDAGTDMDSSNYDSLPRVSRSAKFTSKLGFATLASKFRRTKNKKDKETSSGSALSALCKQTLLADIIAGPQMVTVEERAYGVARHEFIAKSHSSPAASALNDRTNDKKDFGGNVRREIERLNKSQSDKFFEPKESYV